MAAAIAANIQRAESWRRIAFMTATAGCLAVAFGVILAVTLLQMGTILAAGRPSPRLSALGARLGRYLDTCTAYLGCAHETRPYPLASEAERPDRVRTRRPRLRVTPA